MTPGGRSRSGDRLSSDSVGSHKGLQNQPGDNNCFLNSAVQVSPVGQGGAGAGRTGQGRAGRGKVRRVRTRRGGMGLSQGKNKVEHGRT